jgi:hypothetical protein
MWQHYVPFVAGTLGIVAETLAAVVAYYDVRVARKAWSKGLRRAAGLAIGRAGFRICFDITAYPLTHTLFTAGNNLALTGEVAVYSFGMVLGAVSSLLVALFLAESEVV